MAKIRILVVDDHEVVRHGLRSALEIESDMQVVGEARSGEEAVQLAAKLRPDVIVLDIKLGDIDGPEVCRRIVARAPKTAVLMLTSYHQDGMILRSLAAGAKGYLLKDVDLTELKKTVRSIYCGNAVLDPRVATRVITVATTTTGGGATPALKHATLSEMDIAIVRQLADGHSNKEIATRVHRSPHTIKDRVEKIAAVLGVHSRTEIVAEALRTGLI